MLRRLATTPLVLLPLLLASPAHGWEDLSSRGLVALPRAAGEVLLSWRLLESDPTGRTFNVYRRAEGETELTLIAASHDLTNYVDATSTAGTTYTYVVRPLDGGTEEGSSNEATVVAQTEGRNYVRYPIDGAASLEGPITEIVMSDVDGDGRLDWIAEAERGSGPSRTYDVAVWSHDGTFLWKTHTNIGPDVNDGGAVWSTSHLAWDLDDDGRAEVIARVLDESDSTHYVAVFDGVTGAELNRRPWPLPPNSPNDRHVISVLYIDDLPHLVIQVGTYGQMSLTLLDAELNERWQLSGTDPNLGDRYTTHCIEIVDVDGDGNDEILSGSNLIDEHGELIRSWNLAHPDVVTIGNIRPDIQGLEVFFGVETQATAGNYLAELETGAMIWSHTGLAHVHGGWAADVDENHDGWECYGFDEPSGGTEPHVYNAAGTEIYSQWAGRPPVRWVGGPIKQVYWSASRLSNYTGSWTATTFAYPLSGLHFGDVVGDYRDEVSGVTDDGYFLIYANPAPIDTQEVTPLQDRHYRILMSHAGTGYDSIHTVLGYGFPPHEEPPDPEADAGPTDPDAGPDGGPGGSGGGGGAAQPGAPSSASDCGCELPARRSPPAVLVVMGLVALATAGRRRYGRPRL